MVSLSIFAMFLVVPATSSAQEPLPGLLMPGSAEGTGTYFTITDSEYLDISLQSSKEITVFLESVPKTISINIEASAAVSATLTLAGLEPNNSYYKYTDSYRNEEIITVDVEGKYVFLQELISPHHVWLQEIKGTAYLSPQDCHNYGDWDEPNSTCTLTHDLTESVMASADNITLDCAGHSIIGLAGGYGIYINGRTGIIIKNCTINNFSYGIFLLQSPINSIINSIATGTQIGIRLYDSSSNIIFGNTANLNNYYGILVQNGSNYNVVLGNATNFNNLHGLTLHSDSNNNTLSNNIANSNNEHGIDIYLSSGNTLTGNIMFGNKYNFYLFGDTDNHFLNTINSSNSVNGKPVYYIKNAANQTYDTSTNAGTFYCIFCDNITLRDLTLTNNGLGVFFWKTNNSRIENTTTSNGLYGILLQYSNNNTLINSNADSNDYYGIVLQFSSDNNIFNNTIALNKYQGIILYSSDNNKIYHNNLIDNYYTPQVYNGGVGNLFDNDYPDGGNYWSDYTGQDIYSGSNQDQPGSDKIGDTPYTFTGGQDRYPFMEENGWLVGPPQEFWAEIKNADTLRIREAPSLMATMIKILPADWVVHILNTTTTAIDGYHWYNIQDATDGSLGYMAGKDATDGTEYLHYDSNRQTEFEEKANYQLTTKTERADKIVESVNHYYNNASAIPSFYSSNDGANYLSIFKENNFPEELILAIAAAESGGHNFDNEIVNIGDSQWGRGIMQIDYPNTYVGSGSGIRWYKNGQINYCRNEATHDCSNAVCYSDACRHYYTNAHQGIFSNIKDGLRALQEKYQYQSVKPVATTTIDNLVITPNDLQKILTTWRYNGFSTSTYLFNTSNKLDNLSLYFPGITYSDPDRLKDKMIAVNQHQERFLSHSPINLYVIDSSGRITGLTSAGIKEEIPNSGYDADTGTGVLLFPDYFHQYEVVGTANGTFGLTIDSIMNNTPIAFNAVDIPILINEVQTYSIDWQKLSQGQEGVTIQIDTNGDGIFDEFVTTGKELTNDDIILQTQTFLNFDPDTLNLKSKSSSVTAYIELPQGFDAKQINISTITLNGSAPALSKPTAIGDYNHNGIPDLMVKFNRQVVQSILMKGDKIKITISGRLNDGRLFKGSDTIKVILSGDPVSNIALASVDGNNNTPLVTIWQQISTFFINLFHWFWNGITSLIPKGSFTPPSTPTVTPIPSPSPIGSFSFSWIDDRRWVENKFLNSKKSSVPDELNNFLLKDIPIATDACGGVAGHTKIITDDYYLDIEIDLNDDGVNEFFIFPQWVCGWGVFIGTGGGPIYIYQNINGEWRRVGDLFGGSFALEQEKIAGFKNIVTNISIGSNAEDINYYQWNQSQSEYEFVKQEYYEWNKIKLEYELLKTEEY